MFRVGLTFVTSSWMIPSPPLPQDSRFPRCRFHPPPRSPCSITSLVQHCRSLFPASQSRDQLFAHQPSLPPSCCQGGTGKVHPPLKSLPDSANSHAQPLSSSYFLTPSPRPGSSGCVQLRGSPGLTHLWPHTQRRPPPEMAVFASRLQLCCQSRRPSTASSELSLL